MIKIISNKRFRELEQKERILENRILNSKVLTFTELRELRKIIHKEARDLDYRMKLLSKVYTDLTKNK